MSSLPTSPTIQNLTAPLPWKSNLLKSYQENYNNSNNEHSKYGKNQYCCVAAYIINSLLTNVQYEAIRRYLNALSAF
jgi:hypothetical protein